MLGFFCKDTFRKVLIFPYAWRLLGHPVEQTMAIYGPQAASGPLAVSAWPVLCKSVILHFYILLSHIHVIQPDFQFYPINELLVFYILLFRNVLWSLNVCYNKNKMKAIIIGISTIFYCYIWPILQNHII